MSQIHSPCWQLAASFYPGGKGNALPFYFYHGTVQKGAGGFVRICIASFAHRAGQHMFGRKQEKSQQEKEENQEYCQFILQPQATVTPCRWPGQSDILQIRGSVASWALNPCHVKNKLPVLQGEGEQRPKTGSSWSFYFVEPRWTKTSDLKLGRWVLWHGNGLLASYLHFLQHQANLSRCRSYHWLNITTMGIKAKPIFLLTLQKTKVKYEGAKTPCATSWTWKNEVGSRLESANATFRHSCYGKRSSLDLF